MLDLHTKKFYSSGLW